MQNFYASPMSLANEEVQALQKDCCEALKGIPSLPVGLKVLQAFFRSLLPTDHILLTFASGEEEDERHVISPEVPIPRDASLKSNATQLAVLKKGPGRVVRIVDNESQSNVCGFVRRLFPQRRFSLLLLRCVFPEDVICSFAVISLKENKTRGNAFNQRHAALAFALFDTLFAYFHTFAADIRTLGQKAENSRFVPLSKLPGMRTVTELLWKVARQDCPVLLLGETGTGKESVAETLYRASARVHGPFIRLNCGSIPDTLIESSLFGHERGAFTGAERTRKGVFERSDKGVLLLDEIGELSLSAQTRLLRVLQEGTFERIGGSEEQSIDVRIIASTHRNLEHMVQQGSFRADLFFRLNVFPIFIPPLRERVEDIPVLVQHLVRRRVTALGVPQVPVISRDNMAELMAYPWPGNIRELHNTVERAVILWGADINCPLEIHPSNRFLTGSGQDAGQGGRDHGDRGQNLERASSFPTLNEVITTHIDRALHRCGGKISGKNGAAELLGVNANTLRSKMKKLGML